MDQKKRMGKYIIIAQKLTFQSMDITLIIGYNKD